jgi:predicted RND superfamily exporter protein
MDSFFSYVLDRQRWILSIIVFITILLLYPLHTLKNDNSLEVWLDKEGEDYVRYRTFVEEFNIRDFIIVAVSGLDFSKRDIRRLYDNLASKLEKIDGINTLYHFNDLSFLFLSPEEIFTDLLISHDRKVYAFWILPEKDAGVRIKQIIREIKSTLRDSLPRKADFHLAGPLVLNAALDEATITQSKTFFPLVALFTAIILLILFKDLKLLFICFTVAATCQIWTLSLISIAGKGMNMVLTALPPLLWVLSLSSMVYMINSLRKEKEVKKAVLKVFKPCSLTIVTTAFGFLSLTTSHITPIREMGVFTFSGLLISGILLFTLTPILLLHVKVYNRHHKKRLFTFSPEAFTNSIARFNGVIILFFAALFSICLYFSLNIERDTNNLHFFKKKSDTYRDYKFISQRLTGHSPVEAVIDLHHSVSMEEIFRISRKLEQEIVPLTGVKRVITAATFYGVNKPDADTYVNRERTKVRLSVLTDLISTTATGSLIAEIKKVLDNSLLSGSPVQKKRPDYYITGVVPLLVKMQDELLATQIRSFSLTFIVISLILLLLLKAFPLALAAMIPNIFPIIVNLGLMGFFHIPLNVATIMIASVAIGIAVDDSLHFLIRYKDSYQKTNDPYRSIITTLRQVGRPVIFTTVVNTIGFGILIFAAFVPMKHFGALMVFTLLSALLADLFLLPALLLRGSKWING